jgi:hypothetical protein
MDIGEIDRVIQILEERDIPLTDISFKMSPSLFARDVLWSLPADFQIKVEMELEDLGKAFIKYRGVRVEVY